MSFSVKGYLVHIGDTIQASERFARRDFVLKIQDGQYSEEVKFQLVNQRCDLIDAYAVGQEVEVWFNLRGRPFEGASGKTWFTNLDAWKIQPVGGVQPQTATQARQNNNPALRAQPQVSAPAGEYDDKLPF